MLQLTKEFLSWAIGLPMVGECWYKGKHVKNDDWKDLSTPANQQMEYRLGFPFLSTEEEMAFFPRTYYQVCHL